MAGKPKPIESSVFLSEVRASGFSEVWTHNHDLNKFQQVNIQINGAKQLERLSDDELLKLAGKGTQYLEPQTNDK